MKKLLLAQCLLCAFLLVVTIFLEICQGNKAVQTGAFGKNTFSNITLADINHNIFGEFFDE